MTQEEIQTKKEELEARKLRTAELKVQTAEIEAGNAYFKANVVAEKSRAEYQKARYEVMHYLLEIDKIEDAYKALMDRKFPANSIVEKISEESINEGGNDVG